MPPNVQIEFISGYSNFLLAFTAAFAFTTMAWALARGWRERIGTILLAIGFLLAGVLISAVALQGRNCVLNLIMTNRFETVAGGVSGLLAGLAALGGAWGRPVKVIAYVLCAGLVAFCAVNMLKNTLSGSWKSLAGLRSGQAAGGGTRSGPRIAELGALSVIPFCMTQDADGRLYVGGVKGDINWEGVIVRVEPQDVGGQLKETVVASNLVRPHGLAFLGEDLYAVRSGQVTMAEKGRMVYKPSGCVTKLSDVDKDGTFDLYTDVVTGLPGAFGVHEATGIAFDPAGWMYISIGVSSDHSPVVEELEGTIVRCKPDGSDLEKFASGVRNPYAITVGPNDEIFCTDNDADELNRGDVVYQVRKGDHFGFPYNQTIGAPQIEGVTPPLWHAEREVLEGIVYAPPGSLPKGYDDCFYVACLWSGKIQQVFVEPGGENGRLKVKRVQPLVDVKFPLAISLDRRNQAIYVVSSYDDRKLYRVTFAGGEGQ